MYMTISRCIAGLFIIFIIGGVVAATDHPAPNPKGGITAWGKPVNGLQAGIRCPKERHTIAPGEVADLEIVIRNVSEEPIEFTYLPPWYLAENKKGTVE